MNMHCAKLNDTQSSDHRVLTLAAASPTLNATRTDLFISARLVIERNSVNGVLVYCVMLSGVTRIIQVVAEEHPQSPGSRDSLPHQLDAKTRVM